MSSTELVTQSPAGLLTKSSDGTAVQIAPAMKRDIAILMSYFSPATKTDDERKYLIRGYAEACEGYSAGVAAEALKRMRFHNPRNPFLPTPQDLREACERAQNGLAEEGRFGPNDRPVKIYGCELTVEDFNDLLEAAKEHDPTVDRKRVRRAIRAVSGYARSKFQGLGVDKNGYDAMGSAQRDDVLSKIELFLISEPAYEKYGTPKDLCGGEVKHALPQFAMSVELYERLCHEYPKASFWNVWQRLRGQVSWADYGPEQQKRLEQWFEDQLSQEQQKIDRAQREREAKREAEIAEEAARRVADAPAREAAAAAREAERRRDLLEVLKKWGATDRWKPSLGPRPDEFGSAVPLDLFTEAGLPIPYPRTLTEAEYKRFESQDNAMMRWRARLWAQEAQLPYNDDTNPWAQWPEFLGPAPDQPGCKVPLFLFERHQIPVPEGHTSEVDRVPQAAQ